MKKVNHKQIFGAVIESIRRECSLNQKEVVDGLNKKNPWLNLSYPSWSRIEIGVAAMSASQFEVFVDYLSPISRFHVLADEIFYRFRTILDIFNKDEEFEVVYDNDSSGTINVKELRQILSPLWGVIGESKTQKTLWAISFACNEKKL